MRTLTLIALATLLAACQPSEDEIAPLYDTAEVEEQDIEVVVEAAGVIEAESTVEVKSKASGEVLAVHAETGDLVEAGSLLVEIDKRTPRNHLDEVEAALVAQQARLRIAETQMQRAAKLYETKTLTQADYEQTQLEHANAQSQVVSARVAVENARITLEDTNVRAPITGTVIEKTVEPGTVISSPTQAVSDGTVLMKMADLSNVQVRARVDETDIGKIVPGMKARVVAAAYPNQPFDGEVLKIEPLAIVEQNVTMFAVLIKIPNRGGLLKPGMNADVEIEIITGEALSVIPTAALRTETDIPQTAQMLGMAENDIRRALGLEEIPEASGNTISFNGQRITLPDGVDAEQVQDLMAKRRSGGEFTQAERAIMRQVMQAAEAAGVNMRGGGNFAGRPGGGGNFGGGGGFRGGGGGNFGGGRPNGSFPSGNERPESATTYQFGGDYWVVAIRDGKVTPVNVRTGLTDLAFSEVVSGLEPTDKVLLLPTASLYDQQAQLQEFIQRRFSGGSPFQRQR